MLNCGMRFCVLLLFFVASFSLSSPVCAESSETVRYRALGHGVWLHTSMKDMSPWGYIPTNGLIVEAEDHSLLVDTAWNDAQTEAIVKWAREVLGKPVRYAVFTHAHEDKMGGVAALRKAGVVTYASAASNRLAPSRQLLPAEHDLVFDQDHRAPLFSLQILDPGPGHTHDNIVVGLPDKGIVFGGCLIRPPGATSLGNTADGDIQHWATAVRNVERAFPGAELIVPSHGPPAGRELFTLTRQLAQKAQTPQKP